MSIRTFFTIVLKIAGIYLLMQGVFYAFSSLATVVLSLGEVLDHPGYFFGVLFTAAGVIGIFIYGIRFLLLRTGWIIDKLSLEQDFREERIELNIHRSTVYLISVMLISGFTIVDGVISLCADIFSYAVNWQVMEEFQRQGIPGTLGYTIVQLIAGFLIFANRRRIVGFIENKRKM